MAGSIAGGKTAAATNKRKYGDDWYKQIGAIGGKKGKADGAIKGFAANPELARIAGRKGGYTSRRGSKKNES